MGKQEQSIFRNQRSAIEVVSASSALSEQSLTTSTFSLSTLADRDAVTAKILAIDAFIGTKGLLTISAAQRKLYLKRLASLKALRKILDKEVLLLAEEK